jgi:hypothetical protein
VGICGVNYRLLIGLHNRLAHFLKDAVLAAPQRYFEQQRGDAPTFLFNPSPSDTRRKSFW